MPTDEIIRKHASLLARPLGALTRVVTKAPVVVLVLGMAAACLCVGLAVALLDFRTSRLDLLNPQSAFNRRWLAYLEEFGDADDIVVVIDGDSQPQVVEAMDDLTEVLQQQPAFRSIMQKVDLSALATQGTALPFLGRTTAGGAVSRRVSTRSRWRLESIECRHRNLVSHRFIFRPGDIE